MSSPLCSPPSSPALLAALAEFGVAASRVLGSTPDLQWSSEGVWPNGTRVDEIAAWLASAPEDALPWVAIVDMELAAHAPPSLADHFVLTDACDGLTEACAAAVRERLTSLAMRLLVL